MMLWEEAGLRSSEFVSRRLSLAFDPALEEPRLERRGAAGLGESPRLWIWGCFRLDVPAAKVLVGAVKGMQTRFTDVSVSMAPSTSRFAALTLTAMDLQPVPASRTLLLAVAGAVENTGMVWKDGRKSVSDWGKAPTRCEIIAGTVSIRTGAAAATVYALDGKGNRKGVVPSTLQDGTLTFSIGPEYATLWYEIAAR